MLGSPELRELTEAERAYLDRVRRRRQVLSYIVGAILFGGATVFPISTDGLRSPDTNIEIASYVCLVLGAGGALGLIYATAIRRPPWLLPGGRYARVGRLSGRYAIVGKPLREYIGLYAVQAVAELKLRGDRVIEVEVCPAVEDFASTGDARIVLSDAEGRRVIDELVREGKRPHLTFGV